MREYDVIVVGTGHAGCEAALASARLGFKTLAITVDLDNVALMPCNPAIGGPAKSQIVREIDALGGQIAKNMDKSCIQMRLLNTGKGPAVQALRAQADKQTYRHEMKLTLEEQDNLDLRQGIVEELLIEDNTVTGVKIKSLEVFKGKKVILATGTFLQGKIIIGNTSFDSGPQNQFPAKKLSEQLEELGFELRRFKTGTPPRVDKNTVDFSELKQEAKLEEPVPLSYSNQQLDNDLEQQDCWEIHTTEETQQVIKDNLESSPMINNQITGEEPRYCPSIETKVKEFPHKTKHKLYLEPEGAATNEMYLAGFSTSLPVQVQLEMLRTLPGFSKAEIVRPAYAIEYDCLDPTSLQPSLETKSINNLYTAGQLNGTSGYEEAAAQGLIAGINAVRDLKGEEPLILKRSEAYMGVLIDDLVTQGTNEPYRMLTSRAEHRLVLRQDNADLRLTELGYELGLIDEERYNAFKEKQRAIAAEKERLRNTKLSPSNEEVQQHLESLDSARITKKDNLARLMKRPELDYQSLASLDPERPELPQAVTEEVEIQLKYEGYIKKQRKQIEKQKELENKKLPDEIDYHEIEGLRLEAKEKLNEIRPVSLGQASRISGVSPADISVLTVHLEKLTE
ncbi:tRNA uridine-5-carboxymethylaminomethyl(34) synthesis enzyme MnmG [Halanaerobacter jeridensis]|uniref:tRNA uridine 5-carboxymethylaminomethyl modification enzyme MnmG n=1 Tax=Halanaerobacter jeridensis TaxID=706427 RepID=A0A938XUI8_9FIRM|nr:tRNA uridine-5-carboxymethylaminomethyl(34) synthesis enzyme MnmG [Halanaerobacter jeridensis]MBM7557770.1 tRNA uridine 5-carboxymethylaminomethyl modification enzyme [Halanaerobacter jeridensis]